LEPAYLPLEQAELPKYVHATLLLCFEVSRSVRLIKQLYGNTTWG
jgi:hypothetical protein